MATIEQMLDLMSEYQSARDAISLQKQSIIDGIYTPEIRAAVAEVEAEFALKSKAVDENIAELDKQIRDGVLVHGETVRGTYLMAVWSKGREGSWDGSKLKGYAAAHPEILQFKKPDGEPSVSIKAR